MQVHIPDSLEIGPFCLESTLFVQNIQCFITVAGIQIIRDNLFLITSYGNTNTKRQFFCLITVAAIQILSDNWIVQSLLQEYKY